MNELTMLSHHSFCLHRCLYFYRLDALFVFGHDISNCQSSIVICVKKEERNVLKLPTSGS